MADNDCSVDFPDPFYQNIKSVSITIPCVLERRARVGVRSIKCVTDRRDQVSPDQAKVTRARRL